MKNFFLKLFATTALLLSGNEQKSLDEVTMKKSLIESKKNKKREDSGILGISLLFFIFFFIGLSVIALAFSYGWWVFYTSLVLTALCTFATKVQESEEKKIRQKLDKKTEMLNNIPDFKKTQRINSPSGNAVIAIDENSMKICIINSWGQDVYNYRDILESEIVEDGNTITKTSRSSQIGGALIGGVLTGGVGAIIGGLSGKKTSTEQVKRIDLKIVVNDTKKPVRIFNLMDCQFELGGAHHKNGMPKDDVIYKRAYQRATRWHSLISVLIKQADDADKKEAEKNRYASQSEREHNEINHVQSIASNSVSVADELLKLSELEKQGIITKEEFDKQKEKVLKN